MLPAKSNTMRGVLIQQVVPPGVACWSAVSDTRPCPSSPQLEPTDIACMSAEVEQSDVARKPAESDTVRGVLTQQVVPPDVASLLIPTQCVAS
jgi:hypothetical protein